MQKMDSSEWHVFSEAGAVNAVITLKRSIAKVLRNCTHSSALTFSVDCDVPKKMGMKASQMMQVVYMVKPMGLASLKVSGTPRVLMAYTVHVYHQQHAVSQDADERQVRYVTL